MNRILVDLKAAGKQYLRSKVGAFFTFVFPILLVLLFGAIFTASQSGKVTIPIQNLDEGMYGAEFVKALNQTGLVNVKEVPADQNLTEYIKNNSLAVALFIPSDFSDQILSVMSGSNPGTANMTMYGDPSQQSTVATANAVVAAVADRMNYVLISARPIVGMGESRTIKESFNYMDFFLPGVVGITIMTNSLFSMTSICATYRNRGYFKLLATTKLKRHEWLLSHFLLYTILMYASLLATFAVGKMAFNMSSVLTPMAFLLIPAGAFLFVSMGMLFGSAVKDPESAAAVANIIGFPMMFLSGSFFQIEAFPHYLQVVAKALPLTYLNNGLRDTMVYGNTASSLINLGVIVAVGIVFAVLASRMMSWKEK
jgi:ABC-2 type transport system permease protein